MATGSHFSKVRRIRGVHIKRTSLHRFDQKTSLKKILVVIISVAFFSAAGSPPEFLYLLCGLFMYFPLNVVASVFSIPLSVYTDLVKCCIFSLSFSFFFFFLMFIFQPRFIILLFLNNKMKNIYLKKSFPFQSTSTSAANARLNLKTFSTTNNERFVSTCRQR